MSSTPYIYVIEDEESISKLITLYLKKEKIESKPFYNAEDALELFHELQQDSYRKEEPDLKAKSGFIS